MKKVPKISSGLKRTYVKNYQTFCGIFSNAIIIAFGKDKITTRYFVFICSTEFQNVNQTIRVSAIL
jgi:hypothetical protein